MDTRQNGASARRDGRAAWVERARRAEGPDETRALYDAWAPSYDDDQRGPAGDDHPLPGVVADLALRLAGPRADVLDAACGTGLVGAALAVHGFTSVDGLDLSPHMLRRARARRVYHDLGPADLAEQAPGAADKFGLVTCVDAFERGHLPPGALGALARVVHRGGHLVVTVSPGRWPLLEAHLSATATRRSARVLDAADHLLHPSTGEWHRVVVLEVTADSAPRRGLPW